MKISIRQLKQIIQERLILEGPLLSADDINSELSSDVYPTNELSRIMKRWDIQLIPSGNSKDGKLGQGAYGIVFDVAYKNKRYALKITLEEEDYRAYEACANLRNKIPALPASALPQIVKQGFEGNWYFTMMEYLDPLSTTMKSSLSKDYVYIEKLEPGITNKMIGKFSKDFVENLEYYIQGSTRLSGENLKNVLSSGHFTKLKNEILNGKIWPGRYVTVRTAPTGFFSADVYFEKFFYDIFADIIDDSLVNSGNIIYYANTLSGLYEKSLQKHVGFQHFPVNKINEIPDLKDKRAKKLLLALRWLDQNEYINGWNDVHFENIMIRTSTNEFVVADVGLFQFQGME